MATASLLGRSAQLRKKMKTKLFVIIPIIIVFLSCQNNSFTSRGNWIGIYSLLDESSLYEEFEKELVDDTIQIKKIISFQGDSLVLTIFNETLYYGFNQDTVKFKLEKDSIKFNYKEKEFAVNYSFNDELLTVDFSFDERVKYRDYFIPVKEYRMSHKKNEISSFLTSNPITIGQRKDKLELDPPTWYHMAEFIQDSLEADYGYGNDWYFYSIEEELFLIIGKYLIHVNGFDDKKVYGLLYDNKITKIEVIKADYPQKYDLKLLRGDWVENNSNEKKKLKIDNEKIIVNTKNYSDTLDWNLNKYGNKILIKKDRFMRQGEFWKILLLTNEDLIIKRKIRENMPPQIETLIFKKE